MTEKPITNAGRFGISLISQIPWVISMLLMGAWYASKIDSRTLAVEVRVANIEAAVQRIEMRQQNMTDDHLQQLEAEIERLRKVGR